MSLALGPVQCKMVLLFAGVFLSTLVLTKSATNSFFSSYVGAEQARIVLQLAINAGYTLDEIRDLFEGPLREAVYTPSANQEWYYAT